MKSVFRESNPICPKIYIRRNKDDCNSSVAAHFNVFFWYIFFRTKVTDVGTMSSLSTSNNIGVMLLHV